MLTPGQLRDFYLDLSDLDFTHLHWLWFTPVLVRTHSQSWARAHPNRFLVHNGEINTIPW